MKLALTVPGFGQIEAPKNIPSGVSAPSNILQVSLTLLTLGGITLALIFLIYGGVLWAISGGDKQRLDRARSTITYSIVGLIVMILAFAIVGFVGTLLGSPPALKNFIPAPRQAPIVVPPGIP